MTQLTKKLQIIPALVGFLLWANLAWTQAPEPAPPQAKPQAEQPVSIPHEISPQEEKELFNSVDDLLHFASKDTGLPLKHAVKRKLTSRDEVTAFIEKSFEEDKDAQRLRRSELVLKKFGLLPQDFDMQKFLIALLREQIAGYYDPKTKTVNLLNWIDPAQQKPVMAHELTHALQDQSFNLKKWMKTEELADKKTTDAADIEDDENSTARQSVVEGQATAVLIDYMLAPTGQSLQSSPQIVAALKEGMLVGTADSVQLHNAPNFIREALTFPYRYGLDFTVALLGVGGKEKAFAGALKNPPITSRQIMEPNTYLSGERIEPMPMPDFKSIFKNYERFDVGAMGEFDVAMLVDEYAGVLASRDLYPHWRGGYYYAVKPKADPSAPLGIFYLSRWSNQEHAAEFAAIYAKSFLKRYKHVHGVAENDRKPLDDMANLQTLTGKNTWLTEDGTVVVDVKNDMVLVTESLDQPTYQKLEQEIFSAASKN